MEKKQNEDEKSYKFHFASSTVVLWYKIKPETIPAILPKTNRWNKMMLG